MKKFSKSTSIVLAVVLSLVLVLGALVSFVPMSFKTKKFTSLAGSLNSSSDIAGGVYGEYNITTSNPSKQSIVDSLVVIKDVFEESGYKNANVYAIGNSKIRVEVSAPNKNDLDFSTKYSKLYSKLTSVGAAPFSLRSTYSLEDTSIVLSGAEHVTKITVSTNNDSKNMTIYFDKEGQELYKQLCSSGLYLVLGDYAQQISVSGVYDYESLSLSNTDWDNLIELEQKIKLGCMKVEVASDTTVINTMSASLSFGESSSSPENNSYAGSMVRTIAFVALLSVILVSLCVFAVRFGFFAVIMLVSLAISSYIFLGIMCLIPSIEFGLSAIFAVAVGVSVIFIYAYNFASKVKSEYSLGKSLSASLESAYKKQLPNILISNIMLFLSSLIMFALSFGEITSVSIILATCFALSMLVNLALIPMIIKMCLSIRGFGRVIFNLEKRKNLLDLDEELAKEEE